MSIKKLSFMLLSAFSLAALLSGCGSSSKKGTSTLDDVTEVNERTCAQCHGSSYNQKSGMPIYSEYVQSKHFKNNLNEVVGCQKCHGGGSQHNGVGPLPYDGQFGRQNPDEAGKCWGCHQPAFIGTYGPTTSATKAHFLNMTSYRVQYINPTSAEGTRCTGCHEPHNPNSGLGAAERKAWAESGHGNIAALPWVPSSTHKWLATGDTADFQTGAPASDCIRCHTADGFKQFVDSGYKNVNNVAGDPKANSPLKCVACHNNDSFSVRRAGAFTARYNSGKNPKTFPNVGNSNLCIACHSARESEDTILGITTNMNNTSFKNSHYMGAAALMYMSNAFKTYTSQTTKVPNSLEGAPITYGKGTIGSYARFNNPNSNTLVSTSNGSVTPGIAFGTFSGTTSTHRKLGTSAIIGAEPYLPLGGNAISTNGPCVTCHMKADNPVAATNGVTFTPPAAGRPANGHSLLIDDATGNQLCLQCHNDNPNLAGGDGKGNAINVYYKTYADLVATQVEPQSECYQNGLGLLKKILLVKYMIKYDPTAYPYFYDMKKDPTGKTSMTDWTRAAVAGDATATAAVAALGSTFTPVPVGGFNDIQAKRLMGACFNLNLMARDAGGFLHARTFVQRLVYDALDYLDNNKMDFTALTSARKLNPTVYYGTNVNVFASNGTLASESMIWMSGTHFSAAKATSATKNTDLVPMKLHP